MAEMFLCWSFQTRRRNFATSNRAEKAMCPHAVLLSLTWSWSRYYIYHSFSAWKSILKWMKLEKSSLESPLKILLYISQYVLKFHDTRIKPKLPPYFLAHLSRRLKWDLSVVVVVIVVNFSHFHLLLQNHWANFNQTWHKAFWMKGIQVSRFKSSNEEKVNSHKVNNGFFFSSLEMLCY